MQKFNTTPARDVAKAVAKPAKISMDLTKGHGSSVTGNHKPVGKAPGTGGVKGFSGSGLKGGHVKV